MFACKTHVVTWRFIHPANTTVSLYEERFLSGMALLWLVFFSSEATTKQLRD